MKLPVEIRGSRIVVSTPPKRVRESAHLLEVCVRDLLHGQPGCQRLERGQDPVALLLLIVIARRHSGTPVEIGPNQALGFEPAQRLAYRGWADVEARCDVALAQLLARKHLA